MKIVLDVKANKVEFLLALLKDLPYVKDISINEQVEGSLLDEIQEAVEDVNLIKEGKLQGRPIEELLNEL